MKNAVVQCSAFCLVLALTGCKPGGPSQIAFDSPETKASGTLTVASPSFPSNGSIPIEFTGYGQSQQPVITWSGAPKETKSLLVLVEDPDAPGGKPFVHWLIRNLPPSAQKIPGVGMDCLNSAGKASYYPPTPPSGPAHHYHFEVFALDRLLDPSADERDGAVKEMDGHVLAKGEFVGLFQKPE